MTYSGIDYSLYLVTDRSLSKGRATEFIVRAAVEGGVTVVQLREKSCSTREFIREAMALRDFLRARHIPLIINDRLDVAMAVEADGVHFGQTDMPIGMARRIVGDSMIIGVSVESVDDAVEAQRAGADYIGASPVFATPTKTDTSSPLGYQGIRDIRRAVKTPVVGIGGLKAANCQAVIESGADGVAVVSAIVSADNPMCAARELSGRIREAKMKSC